MSLHVKVLRVHLHTVLWKLCKGTSLLQGMSKLSMHVIPLSFGMIYRNTNNVGDSSRPGIKLHLLGMSPQLVQLLCFGHKDVDLNCCTYVQGERW